MEHFTSIIYNITKVTIVGDNYLILMETYVIYDWISKNCSKSHIWYFTNYQFEY